MDPAVIAALASTISQWRGQEYVELVAFTTVSWYYLTTLDDEMKYIWPQPTLKVGKVLYYASRTAFVGTAFSKIWGHYPTHATLNFDACNAASALYVAMPVVAFFAAEAILWLCLYALLQGKRRYFIILAFLLVGFFVPSVAMQAFMRTKPGFRAVPPTRLNQELGYPCTWEWEIMTTPFSAPNLRIAQAYLGLARTVFTMGLTIVAFAVHYRKQNNRLIRIIRREGGFYYIAASTIGLVQALLATPNVKIEDPYGILNGLTYLRLLFTDRLLLLLRQSEDSGTHASISALVFDKTQRADSSFDDEYETDDDPRSYDVSIEGDVEMEERSKSSPTPGEKGKMPERGSDVVDMVPAGTVETKV